MSAQRTEGKPLEVSLISIGTDAAKVMSPNGGKKPMLERILITNSYPMNAGASPVQILSLAPKRKRALVAVNVQPYTQVNSLSATGSATDPAGGGTVAFLNGVGPGTWNITVTAYLTGTIAAGDANNMKLALSPGFITELTIPIPPVANVPVTVSTQLTVTQASSLTVAAIAAASGVSAIYSASIVATDVNVSNPSVVAFGTSASDVEQALQSPNEFIGAVAYVNSSLGNPVMDIRGNTELWAGLITAGSTPCVVSTFKEICR